jgi:hypothetical protein
VDIEAEEDEDDDEEEEEGGTSSLANLLWRGGGYIMGDI